MGRPNRMGGIIRKKNSMRLYKFRPYMNEFVVLAGLKHGSRYLNEITTHTIPLPDDFDLMDKILKELFIDVEHPLTNSKIQIKKTTKKLKVPTFFVYRDPYEAYCSSIMQGTMINGANNTPLWDGDINNMKPLMAGTGHFCYYTWRSVLSLIEKTECEDIKFVNLNELSDLILSNTLTHHSHNKEHNTERNLMQLKLKKVNSKDELIELCKISNPILWDMYMEQIRLDTIALNILLEKYKWINPMLQSDTTKVVNKKKK